VDVRFSALGFAGIAKERQELLVLLSRFARRRLRSIDHFY
jgi:hypothetical protein